MSAFCLLAGAGTASAHELICEKTFNGEQVLSVDTYPASVEVVITISNTHLSSPSTALAVEITGLPDESGLFSPPFTLPVGGSQTATLNVHIGSYQECLALAALDFVADNTLNNTVKVIWDMGSSQCGAQLICKPPGEQPPGGATRTMGFFKTHEQATQACLAAGPIDLELVTVDTLEEALGLLWASPAKYDGGGKRTEWDRSALLLGRQLMVAICNERLFGADLSAALVEQSLAALGGTDCGLMHSLQSQLDAFNNSNDEVPFPPGFDPGPATPQHARDIADDPTSRTTNVCQ
ncbi:MAG TPA: hypothetical protein VFB81_21130 [Myxococcales bacterium]|nr:hypothetical protein [Myxococcales bacterium]